MNSKIILYDTTLRDGSQLQEVSFSVADKLAIVEELDDFGVHYIEGGWPTLINAKDVEFFKAARKLRFKHAKLVAFGSTRRARLKAQEDENLKGLLQAQTPTVCIVGKTWDFHVAKVLGVSLEENLKMVADSVGYLKAKKREVFFDSEHFFDAYKANPDYARQVLSAALEAGADALVLCDTNGGSTPAEVGRIVAEMASDFPGTALGIHAHNDSDLAVANTLMAVEAGATQVQGTINGLGERCGNANLISVIPNLKFKMGLETIPEKNMARLTEVSRFVANVANLGVSDHQPFVGLSAFTHKAGLHSSAVLKDPLSYEHVKPEWVGNHRRILVSEQAGIAAVIAKAKQMGIKLDREAPGTRQIVEKVKQMEARGYLFEAADASLYILLRKAQGTHQSFFEQEKYHVIVERGETGGMLAEATVKVRVKGRSQHTVAEGDGPVNALDNALRKALLEYYPTLVQTKLVDYKVRVLQSKDGTGGWVRVMIETTDGKDAWGTVGVHENIIQATWEALTDSLEYKLLKDKAK